MPLLKDLISSQLFSGVPSNAVWDLIKVTWEKVTARSWEDLYLDAFQAALVEEHPRLTKYADGDIGLDREALRQVLHYDLGASVPTMTLSALTDEQFSISLAVALSNQRALVIGGNNLSQEDYAQVVRTLVRRATGIFKASVIQNQPSFQQAMIDQALHNESLLKETQTYLDGHFQLVLQQLAQNTELLHQIGATTEEIKRILQPLPANSTSIAPSSEPGLCILHLSGLHAQTAHEVYRDRVQLTSDLKRELGVNHLDYLVIAGDVADSAQPQEYSIAVEFVLTLAREFKLDLDHVIVVPGNHDVNWAASKQAYHEFVYFSDLMSSPPEGRYIPAGDQGVLLRDEKLYELRFAPFNEPFYAKVLGAPGYPLGYADQGVLYQYPDDRLIILGLNSCWEADHYKPHRDRTGINAEALARSLDQLQDEAHDDWLKLAVFHHPVTGREAMHNTDFLQLLAVNGFQVCLTGHIYEATESFHTYDARRGIHIVGAGIFSIPANWNAAGIPMQYNLLSLERTGRRATVETRKKEKPDGAWMADARWGDKNNPSPRYTIQLK